MQRSRWNGCARNYAKTKLLEIPFRLATNAKMPRLMRWSAIRKRHAFYNHMPAHEIASKVPPDFWSSATKLTVERHPYERIVSAAYFRLSRQPSVTHEELTEKIEFLLDLQVYRNFPLYTIDGSNWKEHTENLTPGSQALFEKFGAVDVETRYEG